MSGADVQVQLSRREVAEPALRFAAQTHSIVNFGLLTGTLRIPDAVAPIDISADPRAGRVVVSVHVDAPREGRPATRVNWLVRQLRDAPDALRVDAFTSGSRSSTSDLLRVVREDQSVLIVDPKKEFRSFRVAATSPLGAKRGVGRGGFIDSVLAALDGFYATVVQQLRPWSAKAPQLPRTARSAVEEAGIDIEPPVRDLDELDGQEPEPLPPETMSEPDVVLRGVEAALSVPLDPDSDEGRPSPAATEPEEHVSWDGAQERLDHERSFDASRETANEQDHQTESLSRPAGTGTRTGASASRRSLRCSKNRRSSPIRRSRPPAVMVRRVRRSGCNASHKQ